MSGQKVNPTWMFHAKGPVTEKDLPVHITRLGLSRRTPGRVPCATTSTTEIFVLAHTGYTSDSFISTVVSFENTFLSV